MEALPSREEWYAALGRRQGAHTSQKLRSAAVAICGLGGLGSHIAPALARAGVGKLILIDFDTVDLTNIHRQQYRLSQIGLLKTAAMEENLRDISPFLQIQVHTVRMTEAEVCPLLSGADVVCEAFDRAEAKAMLTHAVLEQLPDAYLVAASGMAGFGPPNAIQTRRITPHFYLCGDGVSDVDHGPGLVASRVMLCAAHQAHTVLRILTGQTDRLE